MRLKPMVSSVSSNTKFLRLKLRLHAAEAGGLLLVGSQVRHRAPKGRGLPRTALPRGEFNKPSLFTHLCSWRAFTKEDFLNTKGLVRAAPTLSQTCGSKILQTTSTSSSTSRTFLVNASGLNGFPRKAVSSSNTP